MTLSKNSQKLLKVLHIYLGGIWSGGAASLFAIHCLYFPDSGPELYARNLTLIVIDFYVIIPAAVGSCITGLLYSQMTRWGYLKHHWLVIKWVCTLALIALGFFWLVPWLGEMIEVSEAIRNINIIDYSQYDVSTNIHLGMTVIQTLLLLFIITISVIKPWGRTRYKW